MPVHSASWMSGQSSQPSVAKKPCTSATLLVTQPLRSAPPFAHRRTAASRRRAARSRASRRCAACAGSAPWWHGPAGWRPRRAGRAAARCRAAAGAPPGRVPSASASPASRRRRPHSITSRRARSVCVPCFVSISSPLARRPSKHTRAMVAPVITVRFGRPSAGCSYARYAPQRSPSFCVTWAGATPCWRGAVVVGDARQADLLAGPHEGLAQRAGAAQPGHVQRAAAAVQIGGAEAFAVLGGAEVPGSTSAQLQPGLPSAAHWS